MIERVSCSKCSGRGCDACLGTGFMRRATVGSATHWVPDVDVVTETKRMIQESSAWIGKRLPSRPRDTRYSEERLEDPPPRRHGHDPLDPAGLWNPPT